MFIAAESLSVGRLEKQPAASSGAKECWHPARETASWLFDAWNHSRWGGRLQTGPALRDGLTFFLIYFEKSGRTIRHWNRGGCRSQKDDKPAALEITGTQTFSADAEKLGAHIAVCGVNPDKMVSMCWSASLWRRTDTGISKG
jgi:hypothetical protein